MTKVSKEVIFTKGKKLFKIEDVDIDKILGSRKEPYGTNKSIKCFISNNDDVIRPLCITIPPIIEYTKCFDSHKTCQAISFKINDNKLLKRYNKVWERVSNLMNKKFDTWYIIW